MTAVRRAYADSRYGQLHYRICLPDAPATRPPLLCLHQTPKSGMDYEQIMPLLAADRLVLAPDTPGYGGSDAPLAPIGIPDFADVMAEFVDGLDAPGIDAAGGLYDVMGYHTGSLTATHLANTRPERVRRVVLVSLAAYDAETRARRLATIDRFPTPTEDASHVTALWNLMNTMNDVGIDLDWRHASLAENLRSGFRLPWGFMAVYRYDFEAALRALRQPALVLCPEDDLWEQTNRQFPLIANGRLLPLRGSAHGFLKLRAGEVAGWIAAFLDASDSSVQDGSPSDASAPGFAAG